MAGLADDAEVFIQHENTTGTNAQPLGGTISASVKPTHIIGVATMSEPALCIEVHDDSIYEVVAYVSK